jgi:purine-nucleoside phosphorylase
MKKGLERWQNPVTASRLGLFFLPGLMVSFKFSWLVELFFYFGPGFWYHLSREAAMSIHIAAKPGENAEAILLPGDPLRAQVIAENYLEKASQYTAVRNIFGYTGIYKGKRVSVQGTGMGIPSISIYANELFRDYGVKRAVRIGTAGSIQEQVRLRDLIIVMSACTDSGANRVRFGGRDFAPTASWNLVKTAYDIASARGWEPLVGSVVSSDMFYTEDPREWELWAKFGCLALEMECAELYTLAAKYRREVLCLLTISDSVLSHEVTTAEERQTSFTRMMEVALETAIS